MAVNCDILIVGGGVIGTSVAFALAAKRAGRVLLLEKSFLGAGASGKAAAVVRQQYSNRLTALLAQKGLRFYERFDELVGGPPVFTRSGLAVIVNDRDRAALEKNVTMQRELGIDVRLLSGQVLADIDPNGRLAEDELAAYEAEAGCVDPVLAVASLGEAARRLGADLRLGVEVKSLVSEGGKVVGVETNEGRYSSPCVVLATGPWAARLAGDVGATLPVQSCRTQTALYRRPADFGRRGIIYADFVQGVWFKPAPGDMVLAGSLGGEEVTQSADPDHYDESADGAWLPLMRQRLTRRCPALHRGCGRGGYGGLVAVTPDWHPIVARLPGGTGAYCAVGFAGHSFALAPAIGQVMAELIVDGQAASLDIAPLRLARFEQKDLNQTPYTHGAFG